MVRLDLRAEPIVLCMPEIDKDRCYDVQRVDMYTDNYGYIIGAYWRSTARTASRSGPWPSRPHASRKGRYGSPSP